jgi:hypothetical protein
VKGALTRIGLAGWLALAVSILGLALRVEHAYTFDGPGRGSDYASHVEGVYWMLKHWRPFNFTPEVPWSVRYQPPLWYAVGALELKFTHSERAIAYVAVFGWTVRQWLLWRIMKQLTPRHHFAAVAALALSAILPISVLTDGKVNPENYHTTLFTIAMYFLWQMERQLRGAKGISYPTAVLFGLFAGLSILTKGTASVLLMVAGIVAVWEFRRIGRAQNWVVAFKRMVGPMASSVAVVCIVTGWWVLPNIERHHHPFPHIWDTDTPKQEPILAQPFFYRRPLGWALPFEWKEYIELPINRDGKRPRPNYWATMISGTWTDWYNRGLCRVKGPVATTDVWGSWAISEPCVSVYKSLMWIGIALTLTALYSVARLARNQLKQTGLPGSLVLPCIVVLGALFPGLFALGYPYDHAAVLNPRYLLPISIPMAACFGVTLASFKPGSTLRIVAHAFAFTAIAAATALVVYERFGG